MISSSNLCKSTLILTFLFGILFTNRTLGQIALPYSENFSGITAANGFPTVAGGAWTRSGTTILQPTYITNSTYNRQGRNDSKYMSFRYNAGSNAYFVGPFTLSAGVSYNAGCWYITDGLSGWTTLKMTYGTAATIAAQTNLISSVSNVTNNNYSQLQGNFSPSTSGYYYIAIYLTSTSAPWYLSVDDFSLSTGIVTCSDITSSPTISDQISSQGLCASHSLSASIPNQSLFSSFVWKKDGQVIDGATNPTYTVPNEPNSMHSYVFEAFCQASGQSIISNSIDVHQNCFSDYSSTIDYMLVQNVTTSGINTSNQTAQVQFDLNWGYSWKDSINWDAAWVFMKYKNESGEWKPCKIKTTGYDHGQGTPNNINVPADQMGAFVSMSQYGNAHVDIQGMQLQWDYGADGISNPGLLEVKVFAIEMVYVPQGDFNVFKEYYFGSYLALNVLAPGSNSAVINNRMSPLITYTGSSGSCRVKGDAGLDSDADGVIDSPNFPTGYRPFYAFKYEMSEQQYSDFLNCLSSTQQTSLGLPIGTTITANNGVYFASSPNRACNLSGTHIVLAYADWAGLRPMSILEFSKAALGPYKEVSLGGSGSTTQDVGYGDSGTSFKTSSGSGYYGMKNIGGTIGETMVHLNSTSFDYSIHGNGELGSIGLTDIINWQNITLISINPFSAVSSVNSIGARLVRTAE